MLLNRIHIRYFQSIERIYKLLTASERWLFYLLMVLFLLSTVALSHRTYTYLTIEVPKSGGSISEGVIGAPRFINPILAVSQTDKDLVELVYAGLMSFDPNGEIVPELAEGYIISDDAKTYTFTLKPNLTFHDGAKLTAHDIAFTVAKSLQPAIKSPERANWEGVSVEVIDERTITFTLTKPYAQFLQNTTIGILPESHWSQLTGDDFIFSKLNTEPIGSGPYTFASARHSTSGILESLALESFKDYALQEPYIKTVTLNFYHGQEDLEQAFITEAIDSTSEMSPQQVTTLLSSNPSQTVTSTLPRIFSIFLNQSNNEAFEYRAVREVLRDTIDKNILINEALDGFGEAIDTPLFSTNPRTEAQNISVQEAREKLEKSGWEYDDELKIYQRDDIDLSFTLATVNTPELKNMASHIVNLWTNIGARVKLELFDSGDLSQSVLRSRSYDALLFGEVIGTHPDPYAFWHSSQVKDPGLNIAMYANSSVDTLLVQARTTIDNAERNEIHMQINEKIVADVSTIFLYAPEFIYLTDTKIQGIHLAPVIEPQQRFANIHLWYMHTGRKFEF